MSQQGAGLPSEIQITELADGVRYRLPDRQLGAARFIGLPLVAFGLCFSGFAVFWMWGAAAAVRLGNDPAGWFGLLFVAFGIPFVLAGLGPIGIGLFILAGHSEIELRGDKLRAIERAGLVRWSWKRPRAGLCRFVVSTAQASRHGTTPSVGVLADLAAIRPEWEAAKSQTRPLLLAVGYQRQLLVLLADELARRSQLLTDEAGVVRQVPAIQVVQEDAAATRAFEELAERPPGCTIEVARAADGVTIAVPPVGMRQEAGCLFIFGLIWCGFMGVFSVSMALGKPDNDGNMPAWAAIPFVGLFWAIGLGMLAGAVHMARRRAVLAVVGDRLLVLQTGLFGSKRREWRRDEIADIRSGPSGAEVNDEPVLELQIHPPLGAGKKSGLLSGRDAKELRWLATELRRALNLRTLSGVETPFQERSEQPAGSLVTVEETTDGGVTLIVPPAGLWHGSRGLFLFALVWCAFMTVFDGLLFAFAGKGDWAGPLAMGAFSLLFWAIGIGMLLGALHMGRRRAVFGVVGDRLLVLQSGPLGGKRYEWRRDEVADIRTGPSGMAVNQVPVLELQVHPRSGKAIGLLAGRDDAELQWLATMLRRSLGVPIEPSP
ncbi:MAG: hypothetical protein K2R98_25020 [Gemmataceae bacterium]|nr:hypothetical protein [Gemmataceae bacterium]